MKKIFPFLLMLLIIASCGKESDDDGNGGDSGIFGVWNVTEKYTYSCNGQNFENNYIYQISIAEWNIDSILVTNFHEQNLTFYGYYSGSSLSITDFPDKDCSISGILNNNTITFNSSCNNKNFRLNSVTNNGCDASIYWNEQYSVVFSATKQ